MKKNIFIVTAILAGITMTSSVIAVRESKNDVLSTSVQAPTQTSTYLAKSSDEAPLTIGPVVSLLEEDSNSESTQLIAQVQQKADTTTITEKKSAENREDAPVAVTVQPKSKIVSRGGLAPQSASSTMKTSSESTASKFSGKKAELLDWWKSAKSVFSIGSVVTVKDVYTGRTFRIKRTLGSKHADCEALTLADAKIIKNIWGGYSWDVRPIHIYIGGRVLAASMSAMPHAGLDSKPAFATVSNRSEGYGTGDNLDVVKNNGMDGHFDVHFLNSKRHKDGQEDPRHQSAIKVAASK